jgi:hypothetical protein
MLLRCAGFRRLVAHRHEQVEHRVQLVAGDDGFGHGRKRTSIRNRDLQPKHPALPPQHRPSRKREGRRPSGGGFLPWRLSDEKKPHLVFTAKTRHTDHRRDELRNCVHVREPAEVLVRLIEAARDPLRRCYGKRLRQERFGAQDHALIRLSAPTPRRRRWRDWSPPRGALLMKAMSLCFILVVGASPAFAAKKIHHHSTARAQAPVVSPYPAPVFPAPAPIDPLYAACTDMRIAFPACPGH